ncbi:MAG: DNA methyltransferase [Candidatus Sulfotelmatobacter sp.]
MSTKTVRYNTQSSPNPRKVVCDWAGSVATSEGTLHQLSPYIGKIKSSIAASLVSQFTHEGDLVYDAFSGSGTVALEAWTAGRRVVASDLSPYAYLLTRAKLFPCRSLEKALEQIEHVSFEANRVRSEIDLRHVPRWVRHFFHPETLRETLAWVTVLRRRRSWFLLASLLGILHHQRPGFLSFPSSHTVPYLRHKIFPPSRFPELYRYRSLRDRLEAKVTRAFRRMPVLDFSVERSCFRRDAGSFTVPEPVDAIITSPPYMRLLHYGRDNRLRLWFLGAYDWRSLDQIVSPNQKAFLKLMNRCFVTWKGLLKANGCCVLIIGDAFGRVVDGDLPEVVSRIATEQVGGFVRVCQYTEKIPNERRVRRGIMGSTSETIVVLQKTTNRQDS